jgi:hypothetical protein
MNLSNDHGSFKMSGRFDGVKAAGTLREKTQDDLFGSCDTRKVSWTVKLS